MRGRGKKPEEWKKIAKERIAILFGEAGEAFRKHPERTKRYLTLALRIGMRYNVRLNKKQKMSVCKKCLSFLKPGVSSRVRTNRDKQAVTVSCLSCGHVSRYPYIREKRIIKKKGKA
jgi:ribonuclease P protein subunit RPR2